MANTRETQPSWWTEASVTLEGKKIKNIHVCSLDKIASSRGRKILWLVASWEKLT